MSRIAPEVVARDSPWAAIQMCVVRRPSTSRGMISPEAGLLLSGDNVDVRWGLSVVTPL